MNTVRNSDRDDADSVSVSGGPRPVFDTLKPVEVDSASAETASAIDDDVQELRDIVARQRSRMLARSLGVGAALAFVAVSSLGSIAQSEANRAFERVQKHVAAANAALPAAAIELPPRVIEEAIAPTVESAPRVAPIPGNGGTPASVFARPGAKKKAPRK